MQTILAQPFGRLLLATVGLGVVASPVCDCPIAIRQM